MPGVQGQNSQNFLSQIHKIFVTLDLYIFLCLRLNEVFFLAHMPKGSAVASQNEGRGEIFFDTRPHPSKKSNSLKI